MLTALITLMDYKFFRGRTGAEDRLAIEVATELRVATLEGRLRATWTHVPHEVGGKGKGAMIRMALAKAMGLIKGSGDFVFVWPEGGGWIELKVQAGRLSAHQSLFRDWCKGTGSRHAVCKTPQEVIDKLTEWGALTERKR
jgi:hypothetical protein